VAEVMSVAQVEPMSRCVDVLQVGARNMQNFPLLRALGEIRLPVLLKRGMSATVEELLMSAEYILAGGNDRVILCERGIRTIPVLKSLTHLPVILDPSHSTGYFEFVTAIARAAIAAGADGLIVEVHPDPVNALSDGHQSLKPEKFTELVKQVEAVALAVGRRLTSVRKPVQV
jgi:3-deoxy-7-phosphoheptulonate synthase